MPIYRAKSRGLMGNVLREAGEKFSHPRVYPEGKVPGWLEVIDDRTLPPLPGKTENGEDRNVTIVNAMKKMVLEDPEFKNPEWWTGKTGAPSVSELEKRTGLKDIKAGERNGLWMALQVPPSGKTPNQS